MLKAEGSLSKTPSTTRLFSLIPYTLYYEFLLLLLLLLLSVFSAHEKDNKDGGSKGGFNK